MLNENCTTDAQNLLPDIEMEKTASELNTYGGFVTTQYYALQHTLNLVGSNNCIVANI